MLLAIDVGNTQTVVGVYDPTKSHDTKNRDDSSTAGLVGNWRLSTVPDRTTDELRIMISSLLATVGIDFEDVTGMAICSGVPRVLMNLRYMCQRYLDIEPLVVNSNMTPPIPILYDNPYEVGADRIANTVAAYDLYGGPTVVVDFGTGNNFDVISAEGAFLGGAITPGIATSLAALFNRAAALEEVELKEPRGVIGKTTTESIQSGTLYGFASMIDGMVERFQAELGKIAVVATGGLAYLIAPVSRHIEHVEPLLTLHGLRLIYHRGQHRAASL